MVRNLNQMKRRLDKLQDQIERRPPKIKHDGNLDPDGDASVSWEEPYINISQIECDITSLTVSQFLSLMEWGKQNREKLEQLAKGQEA